MGRSLPRSIQPNVYHLSRSKGKEVKVKVSLLLSTGFFWQKVKALGPCTCVAEHKLWRLLVIGPEILGV